ncbi:MAG: metallophosphoesterase [Bermanella sp.]
MILINISAAVGNHEFYKSTYPKLFDTAREMAEGTNVHILENEVLAIDDVNFLGCTLWTDFEMFGDSRIAGYHCQQTMNDYRKIKRLPNYSKMRAIDTSRIHRESKTWLAKELDVRKGERNIVVTHHGPSLKSVSAEFHNDLTTAAYASNLEGFIEKHSPSFWLHGHTHNNSDYLIEGCRVLCNPKGYCGYENPDFKPFDTFEV